jgi:hypothetical protein
MSVRICLTQINTRLDEASRRMNTKYVVVVAAMAAMLVATTALATDNAFADKNRKHGGYTKSQAVSQENDCGNGDNPIDVFCQNLASQIQGDNNAPALAAEQGPGAD